MKLSFPANVPGVVHDLLFGKGTFAQRLAIVEQKYGHAFSLRGIPFWMHTTMHVIAAVAISYLLMRFSDPVYQWAVGALVLFFAFQEFSLHPKWYGQKRMKSVVDFLSWAVPLVTIFVLHT